MVESRIFRFDPADRVTKEFWQHYLFILEFRSHALGNAFDAFRVHRFVTLSFASFVLVASVPMTLGHDAQWFQIA